VIVANAIQSVLTIMIMIGLGYILTYRGWFDQNTSRLFSKLVINVSLPAAMFSNLINTFSKDKLMASGIGLLIPFGTMFLCYGVSMIISRVLKMKPKRRAVFQIMFTLSNTIFIGLPVNMALFGEESVPFVILYYIANTTTFWTIGVYAIRQASTKAEGSIFTLDTFKRIFSPPLIGFLAAIIFVLFKVHTPKFLIDTTRYVGNLATPLSMLFIGIIIHGIDIKGIRFNLDTAILLAGRFLFCPLLTLAVLQYFSVPQLMKQVFVMEAAMPVMTQSAIVAQAYNADHKYATVMFSVTTLAGLIVIPIYGIILSLI